QRCSAMALRKELMWVFLPRRSGSGSGSGSGSFLADLLIDNCGGRSLVPHFRHPPVCLVGDKGSGAGGSEAARSSPASPAAPSWLLGRQWLGRAACCAAATAVALSLIASADCSAVAAAATIPSPAATAAAQPGIAMRLQQAVQLRMHDSRSQDPTQREAVRGGVNPTWLRQPKPQSPAVLVARGFALVLQPIAQPGASGAGGAGVAADASWYESVYNRPAMATLQPLADVAGADTGAGAPSHPASSGSHFDPGRNAEVPRRVSQAPSAPSPPIFEFTLQSGRAAPAATVDWLVGSGGGEGSGGERRLGGLPAAEPGVVGMGGRVRTSASTSTSTSTQPIRIPHRSSPGSTSELASETEDRLLEVARQVEARVEGVLGAVIGGVPQLLTGSETEQVREGGREGHNSECGPLSSQIGAPPPPPPPPPPLSPEPMPPSPPPPRRIAISTGARQLRLLQIRQGKWTKRSHLGS
ncbi:hypothetical protein Vafri_14379, partial [Volvox africanus]